MVQTEGHSKGLLTDFDHQVVNDAIVKVRSSHTALSDSAVDGKPARVHSIHPNTALSTVIQLLKQENYFGPMALKICKKEV